MSKAATTPDIRRQGSPPLTSTPTGFTLQWTHPQLTASTSATFQTHHMMSALGRSTCLSSSKSKTHQPPNQTNQPNQPEGTSSQPLPGNISALADNCIPDAKRGYYGFIIVVVLVHRDFLLTTYSPHFFPDFFHIWQVA